MLKNYLMILAGLVIAAVAVARASSDYVLATSEPVVMSLAEEDDIEPSSADQPEPPASIQQSPERFGSLAPSFLAVNESGWIMEQPGGMEPLYLPSEFSELEPQAPPLELNSIQPDDMYANFSTEVAAAEKEPSQGEIPVRLEIPAIGLIAPVIPSRTAKAIFKGQEFLQWMAPDYFAVGWHKSSALLGLPGNTVLNGHHNDFGEVFRSLEKLVEGDLIHVHSDSQQYTYVVANRLILPEKYEPPQVRMENARWIQPSSDERLTLITCWPYETNTHRLILIARPLATSP